MAELIDMSQQEKPGKGLNPKKFTGLIVVLVVVAIVAVYLLSGFFLVGPAEVGLVKRFGAFTTSVGPGLHYHLPVPIESVVVVNTANVRKQELGFQTISPGRYRELEDEALMLTGDGNIVYVEAVVQYYIGNAEEFAFNLVSDSDVVKFTAESVLREEVAASDIDDILTTERDKIAARTVERIQSEFDSLKVGITVKNFYLQEVRPPTKVVASFDDVNNAKQDKVKLVNEAEKYSNDVIPKAEGMASQMKREAEAYAQEKVLNARGETQRFTEILKEYSKAPEITRTRLYLETLNNILKGTSKYVVMDQSGVLKLLDLPELEGVTK